MESPSTTKRIVAFGHFDLEGARSWVIRTGLGERGCEVTLCRTEAEGLFAKYTDLGRRWNAMPAKPDAIYVPFLGHYLMLLAWRLGRREGIPVILDAFLSLYDTEVHDRKRVSRWSPHAWFLWFTDWLACHLATVVLLDTEEHKRYFVDTFGLTPEKILVLPIGCRTDLFLPLPPRGRGPGGGGWDNQKQEQTQFTIRFHGTFIPLQGIDTILLAAKELQDRGENVTFELAGKGQTYPAMRRLADELGLRNVQFLGTLTMTELPAFVNGADICLGIFGASGKAARVIPNKAYEVIACGRPLVTGRTPASERVFRHGQDSFLVTSGDPHALAEAILTLRNDEQLRKKIGEGGLRLSQAQFQPRTIVASLTEWLETYG
ncbi:MAG: group 1 glycosyl transferase [Candidatus Peregrinibacteria bacterium Greene0416_19]|nr:MAG: group 1 glycosyl transferase [Candidatus Peregrinibacteria bacterium Greene0416_19]